MAWSLVMRWLSCRLSIAPGSSVNETPVMIVGAGPVGLCLALDLGWRGVPCMLVEQGGREVEHSRIGHIAVRTMEFFRRWGIARAVREAGFPDDFRMSRVVCTSVAASPLYVDEHKTLRDMPEIGRAHV